jgi:hypothetical protein
MNAETVLDFLLWGVAIVYAVLFLWFLIYMAIRKWKRRHLFRVHLPEQECDIWE